MVGTIHRRILALALVGGALFALPSAYAQPVVDQALSDAQVAVEKGCTILKVTFNIRIRYASHFPLDRGDELRITVNPIDRNQAAGLLTLRREAASVPDGKRNGIKAIDLETQDPSGPVLRILFDRPVAYQVAPNSDTQSIVVAIAGSAPRQCRKHAVQRPAGRQDFRPGPQGGCRLDGRGTGSAAQEQSRCCDSAPDEDSQISGKPI